MRHHVDTVNSEEEKKPPCNIPAEQALLGSLLISNDCSEHIVDFLQPGHFFDPLHGKIYQIIISLITEGTPATPAILSPLFDGVLVGGLTVQQYLGQLAANAVSPAFVKSYGNTIKELSLRRSLVIFSEDAIDSAYNANPDVSIKQIIDVYEDQLYKLTSDFQDENQQYSIGEAATFATSDLSDTLITTGYKDLDSKLGGYGRGQYIIIAGRPGMGKSAFAQSSMLRMAKAGYGIAYFSLEMTKMEVGARCLSDLCYNSQDPIEYREIVNRRIQDRHQHRLNQATETLKELPIRVDERAGIGVSQIASRSRQIAREFSRTGQSLDAIIVDHMGFVASSGKYSGQKVNEVGEISNGLRSLAKELDVAMIGLHQLNRGVEGREGKRPTPADLRDSGNLEQDAHVILFPYRQVYYLMKQNVSDENRAAHEEMIERCKDNIEIIIGKQRNGPSDIAVPMYAYIGSNAIRSKSLFA